MTRDHYGGLFAALKRVGGRCLDGGVVLDSWLAANPEANATDARQHTPGFCAPFPSIDGNPPKYRDRPFFCARTHES